MGRYACPYVGRMKPLLTEMCHYIYRSSLANYTSSCLDMMRKGTPQPSRSVIRCGDEFCEFCSQKSCVSRQSPSSRSFPLTFQFHGLPDDSRFNIVIPVPFDDDLRSVDRPPFDAVHVRLHLVIRRQVQPLLKESKGDTRKGGGDGAGDLRAEGGEDVGVLRDVTSAKDWYK